MTVKRIVKVKKTLTKVELPAVYLGYRLVGFVSFLSARGTVNSGGHYRTVLNHSSLGWYQYDDGAVDPIDDEDLFRTESSRFVVAIYYKSEVDRLNIATNQNHMRLNTIHEK